MLHVHYSNRTEALLEILVRKLDARRARGVSPLEPVLIVVPNRNMERYIELGVARGLGIAANLRFHRLERFLQERIEETDARLKVMDRGALVTFVLGALLDDALLRKPEMRTVVSYLHGAGDDADAIDLRRVQLAQRVGSLFDEYALSRPAMLDAWSRGALVTERPSEPWQRLLFEHAMDIARREETRTWTLPHVALRTLERGPASAVASDEAEELHFFGMSYVAPVYQWAFEVLGRRASLHLYTMNPCKEFWEDVRRPKPGMRSEDTVDGDAPDGDAPLLALWGRPGREYVHALVELAQGQFDGSFRDPLEDGAPTLLKRMQHDVLVRSTDHSSDREALVSQEAPGLSVFACPGVRREVEAIADEIWALIREDEHRPSGTPPLRFNDIAVLVGGAARNAYLPHIEAVFGEASNIPHNVVDVPLTIGSRIVEAALSLFALPLSRFARPDVLGLLSHPAVRGRVPDLDAQAWIELSDRLGVFHGIDHQDHAGTYIERDVLNWDQAVRRIVLGAFMTGQQSGDERAYTFGADEYLPEEAEGDAAAASLALLVRSLSNDARFARTQRLTLREWADFLVGLLEGYIVPSNNVEEGELRRCLAALHAVAERPLGDVRVSYRIAVELARDALESLSSGRGEYLADGVVVSSLLPMRTIPFRVVFIAGLSEGCFPAIDRRDAIDLRQAQRRIGDVSPSERDAYTFLEAMLSAREKLYLTYVARDELTGDGVEPSSIVRQLFDVLREHYIGGRTDRLVRRFVLRRYEPENASLTVLEEAREEARARALGSDYREHLRRCFGGNAPATESLADALSRLAHASGTQWSAVASLLRVESVTPSEASAMEAAEPAAPSIKPSEEEIERIQLSTFTLRRFLESPLQGWARAVLGIQEEDAEAVEAREDEPFVAPPLDSAILLRNVFVQAVRDGRDAVAAYQEGIARLEAQGRWPTGVLRDLRSDRDRRILDTWLSSYARLASAETGALLERIRFGPAAEHGDADRLLDPIVLDVTDPRRHGSGTLRVELVGRSEPLLHVPTKEVLVPGTMIDRASLLLFNRPRGTDWRSLTDRLRLGLRAFFDHIALAASGITASGVHRGVVLHGPGAGEDPKSTEAIWRMSFAPVTQGTARAWLANLVRDLLGSTHAYALPCEAVLRRNHRWATIDGNDLVASVEYVNKAWDGGQSRFGPVPDALDYPPPPPEQALAMAQRRFGLFFELADFERES